MTTAYITHTDCRLHDMGVGHPEQPNRLGAVEDRLITSGLIDLMRFYEAQEAPMEHLALAHDELYLDELFARAPQGDEQVQVDPDTCMNRHSLRAARLAAGAVVQAVDLVMSGEAHSAFCNVRPPGHHAEHNAAMGFCFFNNIAIGVRHAQRHHGIQRAAVIDFDVHYGNGTADIFAGDDSVMLCSSYEYPLYPLSEDPPSQGTQINCALPPGSGTAAFHEVVQTVWVPALREFAPELLFFSAGFDAHREDPLAGLNLTRHDYSWATETIMRATEASTRGRVVSALEGGYNLSALGRSAASHVQALMETRRPEA